MDFFDKFRPGEIIAVLAIVGGVLIVLVAIVGGVWYANARNRHDAMLRREMLDRGMSAAEIEQAMRGFGQPAAAEVSSADSLWYDAELAKHLASVEEGKYSPQTIEFVLSVFRPIPAKEKDAVYNAIWGMIDDDAGEEQLLAAVRALCRPAETREFASNDSLEMRR